MDRQPSKIRRDDDPEQAALRDPPLTVRDIRYPIRLTNEIVELLVQRAVDQGFRMGVDNAD